MSDGPGQTGYQIGTFIAPKRAGHIYSYQGTRTNQGSSFTLAKWHHIALCRSGNVSKMFLDGVQQGSDLTDTRDISATYLLLGGYYGTTSSLWKGYISNFRLVNGTGLYTTNFTPSTEKLTAVPNTEILAFQSNRFIDESTNNHSLNGDSKVSAFNPFGQGSEYAVGENKGSTYFDGSSLLSMATPDAFNTGDYTMEGWLYCDDASGTWQSIISRGYAGSDGFRLYKKASVTELVLYKGTSAIATTSGANLKNSEWVHFAVVRNSSTINIYINGVSKVSVSNSTNTSSVDPTNIGGNIGEASNYPFDGYISDLKIISGTATYTSTFTPPTAPVGNANADLYLPMDNA